MGKASILLVAGYSVILLLTGLTMSNVRTQAYDNAMDYYEEAVVRNIAIAGANMAANYLFLNPPLINGNPWFAGYTTPVSFNGGTFTVTVDSTSSIDPISGNRRLTLRSRGLYRDSSYTVTVIMQPSNFAKFAYYGGSTASQVYWETGDSILGPSHTQGTLRVTGKPYFGGKATVKDGVDSSWAGDPIFNAGFETGVSIPLNKSFEKLRQKASEAGGKMFTGAGDLFMKFKGDSVMWHRTGKPDTTSYLPSFAPNGAIVLGNNTGDVYVEGVMKGRYTIGALDTTGINGNPYGTPPTKGRVFVTGNLTYATDPRVDPTSTDMLGIVAWHDIQIKNNNASSFTVHGSLFSYKNGISVESYSTRNPGQLFSYGGWIVENLYATSNGIALGSAGSKGYKVNLKFDERFRTTAPPFFPTTFAYEILAWYE